MKFITIYFNYYKSKRRYQLMKEFLERYPNVELIEIAYGTDDYVFDRNGLKSREYNVSWHTNKYINLYYSLHKCDICFIDGDVVLYNNFFQSVQDSLSVKYPLFIQPFTKLQMVYKDSLSHIISSRMIDPAGHTGMIYAYSKEFLRVIKLPESLVLGSFDTCLYLSLFREVKNFDGYCNIIGNEKIVKEIKKFCSLVKDVKYSYIEGHIYSFSDGCNKKYNERLFLYRDINQKVIDKYFLERNEDEYY